MARQPPQCCCCVPRRPGLLAWAYIRLVLGLTFFGLYLHSTWYWLEYIYYHGGLPYYSIFTLRQIAPIPLSLVYILFTIIFIIGVHRENSKMLLTFLVYSIFEVILGVVVVVWQMYYFVDELAFNRNSKYFENFLRRYIYDPSFYLRMIGPVVVNILLPIYFMVLIKSEVQRLKTARGETRAVLDEPVTKEQDKRYNLSYIH